MDKNLKNSNQNILLLRIIFIELFIIGTIIFVGGIVMINAGEIGVERFNQATGKLIRMVSNQDKHYYSLLKSMISIGHIIKIVGLVVMFPGILFSIVPTKIDFILNILNIKKNNKNDGDNI